MARKEDIPEMQNLLRGIIGDYEFYDEDVLLEGLKTSAVLINHGEADDGKMVGVITITNVVEGNPTDVTYTISGLAIRDDCTRQKVPCGLSKYGGAAAEIVRYVLKKAELRNSVASFAFTMSDPGYFSAELRGCGFRFVDGCEHYSEHNFRPHCTDGKTRSWDCNCFTYLRPAQ
jgi:N-acetylglutamate synthase-like GNAT family acetyltransferase